MRLHYPVLYVAVLPRSVRRETLHVRGSYLFSHCFLYIWLTQPPLLAETLLLLFFYSLSPSHCPRLHILPNTMYISPSHCLINIFFCVCLFLSRPPVISPSPFILFLCAGWDISCWFSGLWKRGEHPEWVIRWDTYPETTPLPTHYYFSGL